MTLYELYQSVFLVLKKFHVFKIQDQHSVRHEMVNRLQFQTRRGTRQRTSWPDLQPESQAPDTPQVLLQPIPGISYTVTWSGVETLNILRSIKKTHHQVFYQIFGVQEVGNFQRYILQIEMQDGGRGEYLANLPLNTHLVHFCGGNLQIRKTRKQAPNTAKKHWDQIMFFLHIFILLAPSNQCKLSFILLFNFFSIILGGDYYFTIKIYFKKNAKRKWPKIKNNFE